MGLKKKLEDIFAAAAFAEAGEHETAREMLKESKREDVKEKGSVIQGPARLVAEED